MPKDPLREAKASLHARRASATFREGGRESDRDNVRDKESDRERVTVRDALEVVVCYELR
jgi:hypothetical protein